MATIRSSARASAGSSRAADRPSSRRRRVFWRSSTKSTSRSSFVPSLNAVKPARASVIMLSASHAREFSLLRFQASSLGLRSSSIVLVVQSGNVCSSFAHSAVDARVEHRRDRPCRAASSALPAFAAVAGLRTRRTRSGRTRRHALRLDQRIGDERAVDLERRHDVGEDAQLVGLVRGERLAQHAGDHRPLGADHHGQEVGRAADRRRAVLGPGLAEAREVLRDREVAGHADLLAAADAHAVDAADHRLVAGEDRRDHVVEQPHVLAVLLRLAGVVLGVFLGVAAGAERLVAARR